jgi:hypothetical protein
MTPDMTIHSRILLPALLLSLAPLSYAESDAEPAARDSEWSFVIAPYAWLAGTGGTIITDGIEQDFDLSFSDILDLTTGGFQIYTQARYKRFYIAFDGTWARLGHGEDFLGGRIDFTVDQTIVEMQSGYRFLGPEFGVTNLEPGDMVLDAYLGARYWRTELSLNVDLPGRPPIIPPTQISESGTDEWVEPLIGVNFRRGLTPTVGVSINGNVGGFGVSGAADLTWTLTMKFDWRFAERWGAAFGWRTQSVEDVSGSGSERNGSKILTTGPIVGLIYRF